MDGPLSEIPACLAQDTEQLRVRFIDACAALDVHVTTPDFERILRCFTGSPFVAELAIADPRWFIEDCVAGVASARDVEFYTHALESLFATAATDDDAYSRMRRLRNREFARIAWRDIVLGAEVGEITNELSAFADACIRVGLAWSEAQCRSRFGDPRDDSGKSVTLNVIAMGKLGGCELNFSSDIDLIFAFPAAGTTTGGRRQLSNQEYFDRLGRHFIGLLSDATADGFVFRVDMRLRPFGDSGPLTSNFDALEHYYQLHGRDWERYALIKARVVTGDPQACARLRGILKPFVYRRYLDFGALEAVREMKSLIDAEVARRDLGRHVKLGSGGIREIEFIGQTFQLIRGGREPRLQQRSILAVLATCSELNLLDPDEAVALRAAYLFLRRTEHRLQQVADRQTHQIPQDLAAQARLAFAMGFASFDNFSLELERHRAIVRRCFHELLLPEGASHAPDEQSADRIRALSLWSDAPDVDGLALLGFDDPVATLGAIEQLRAPAFLNRLSRVGQDRLNRLMPQLIETAGRGAYSAATFSRLTELVRAIARRSVYLSLLAEHPATLARLIDLYAASPWIARQITQQPLLLDELLDPRVLFAPPGRDELVQQLGVRLAVHAADNVERVMDTLRTFKNQQVLRVAASDITERFPIAEVSNQLSYIAAALLHHALAIAASILKQKHGEPYCRDRGQQRRVGFAIIAYGKLGGLELGYGSDLDLVFVHDGRGEQQLTDGERAVDNGVYFTRLTQRIIHFLGTLTAAGRAYEIDTRLRPSGESGLLVTSIDAFRQYQANEAWTWEHQALIRARAVAGDVTTMAAFERVRRDTLAVPRDAKQLQSDILDMRQRMRAELDRSDKVFFDLKQGLGGITDIEFMVQYAVLKWAHEHPDLLEFPDNLRLLAVLSRLGVMRASACTNLHDAYFAYRAEVHRSALQEIEGLVDDSKYRQHRAAVRAVWRELFACDT